MREGVWCWALGSPRSPCGSGQHAVQSKALKELLHLPLRPEENAHLIHFLSHPPRTISPPALSLLHDLVTLRLIHQGQYAESLQLDKELAGSGGKEEDRQRRREMVREFIAILPEAQRRALFVESEVTASKKEQERSKAVNGFVEEPAVADVDMGGSWIDVELELHDAPIAPMPIRQSNSLLSIAQAVPLPASPGPVLSRPQTNSAFAGPPRFTSSVVPGSPVASSASMRVLSGSPFTLPKNAAASSSHHPPGLPRPPRKIINDDEDPVEPFSRRPARDRGVSKPPTGAPDNEMSDGAEVDENQPPNKEAQPTPAPRRSRRIVSNSSQAPKESRPPSSPPPKATRNRQATAPPSMPGAFLSEPVPEDDVPPPPTSSAIPEGSSRLTRNATKAVLDDEQGPTPTAKRAKSNAGGPRKGRGSVAASEITDDGAVMGVRRSTRRAATAQPSERGSPTPSVSARSDAGRRKRVEGSQTPRMTTRSRRG